MADMIMDNTTLENPRWKRRGKTVWKGGANPLNVNAWQLCFDENRTKGNLGQVMPILAEHKEGGQFASNYTVQERVETEEGPEIQDRMVSAYEFKQHASVEEAKTAKPPREVVDALMDRYCREQEQMLRDAGRLSPSEIMEELDAIRTMILRANGFEDPELAKQVQIKAERAKVRGARGAKG